MPEDAEAIASVILKLELSGQVILDFLLDHFVPAVLYYDFCILHRRAGTFQGRQKLLAIFSGNYKQDYQKPEPARNLLTCTSGC